MDDYLNKKVAPKRRVITAAATLNPLDRYIEAVVPLAAANNYLITLPPVGDEACIGAEIVIVARRAAGVYVDGEVAVAAAGDSKVTFAQTDGLTADGTDLFVIKNYGGVVWSLVVDVST